MARLRKVVPAHVAALVAVITGALPCFVIHSAFSAARTSATKRQASASGADSQPAVVDAGELQGPGVGRQWQSVPGSPATDGQSDAWKRELLSVCAAANRGFSGTEEEKARVLELVQALEKSFKPPEGESLRKAALEGTWSIIYTTSPDLESLDRLPLPGWRTARVGQSFFDNLDATNEIEFVSPFGSRVNQTVECTWDLYQPERDSLKVALTFRGSSTKLASVAGLGLPVDVPALSLPLPPGTGVFKVSYIDDDLLVQRTQAGPREGVNIMVRS
eukprot:TRINITY_DN32041_c0_g1_i1.p1 TRINITY_DN32041_c0_g1~~TRINITY_DN32041_c0_g1_i1.p1  ORF type:complete len:294 (+),score=47.69 TRINITY_DN32041_c0_g1_i1:60-884(+)